MTTTEATRQRIEDATQRGRERRGVFLDQLGIGLAERREVAAAGPLVRCAPAVKRVC